MTGEPSFASPPYATELRGRSSWLAGAASSLLISWVGRERVTGDPLLDSNAGDDSVLGRRTSKTGLGVALSSGEWARSFGDPNSADSFGRRRSSEALRLGMAGTGGKSGELSDLSGIFSFSFSLPLERVNRLRRPPELLRGCTMGSLGAGTGRVGSAHMMDVRDWSTERRAGPASVVIMASAGRDCLRCLPDERRMPSETVRSAALLRGPTPSPPYLLFAGGARACAVGTGAAGRVAGSRWLGNALAVAMLAADSVGEVLYGCAGGDGDSDCSRVGLAASAGAATSLLTPKPPTGPSPRPKTGLREAPSVGGGGDELFRCRSCFFLRSVEDGGFSDTSGDTSLAGRTLSALLRRDADDPSPARFGALLTAVKSGWTIAPPSELFEDDAERVGRGGRGMLDGGGGGGETILPEPPLPAWTWPCAVRRTGVRNALAIRSSAADAADWMDEFEPILDVMDGRVGIFFFRSAGVCGSSGRLRVGGGAERRLLLIVSVLVLADICGRAGAGLLGGGGATGPRATGAARCAACRGGRGAGEIDRVGRPAVACGIKCEPRIGTGEMACELPGCGEIDRCGYPPSPRRAGDAAGEGDALRAASCGERVDGPPRLGDMRARNAGVMY